MFHVKNHKQLNIFDPWEYLGPKRRKLLDNSWSGLFHQEILPNLPVESLRGHYHNWNGRPTKELYSMIWEWCFFNRCMIWPTIRLLNSSVSICNGIMPLISQTPLMRLLISAINRFGLCVAWCPLTRHTTKCLTGHWKHCKRFSNYTRRTTPLQGVNYTSKLDQTYLWYGFNLSRREAARQQYPVILYSLGKR